MSKDYLDKWEERAKQNTEIIEQQQAKTKKMKKLILTLATITTLISCNKEELKPQCNCKVTYEKELFGTW